MQLPKIGLVTVLYKSDNVLKGFFESLAAQSFDNYILFCIDNSPTEGTREIMADLSKLFNLTSKVRHIENDVNAGVAAGNNQGIVAALNDNCEYVLILNNDIEFYQAGLLEEILQVAVEKNENIIIPKIFFAEDKSNIIWMAGGKIDKLRGLVTHIGEGEIDSEDYNKEKYFKYAPTCFMLVAKKVFETIGIMDENYFVYYDDVDFVYRAVKSGFNVLLLPSFKVYHKVGNSVGGFSNTFIYYFNRNRLYFSIKRLPFLYKLTSLFFYIVTRIQWHLKFDAQQRKSNLSGISEGIRLCFKKANFGSYSSIKKDNTHK